MSVYKYSFIDKVVDEDKTNYKENSPAIFMASILRRDLENLLNTYKSWLVPSEELTELNKSIISYGIEDISCYDLNSAKACENLCNQLEEVIQQYEPRLHQVKVQAIEHDRFERMLKLRIEAIFEVETIIMPIIYRTILDKGNSKFSIINDFL